MLDTGLKILIVASEVVPFAKTGGLADVAGSLPKALAVQGNDVRVVLPRYGSIEGLSTVTDFPVQVGNRKETCIVRSSGIEAKNNGSSTTVPVYLLDNYHYFHRDGYYMFHDDGERFAFFNMAVVNLCEKLNFIPDVVHCNDWHTGMIPLLIRNREREKPAWKQVSTVYTIHNLKYQGNFPKDLLNVFGLGDEQYHPQGLEFYGNMSFMKAGIVYSDVVNTVSDTYAKEIQTAEMGERLHGILKKRKNDLFGIVNGINYHEFDPKTDPRLYRNYDFSDPEGKRENKYALQRELGLEVSDKALIGLVSRLVHQKGLDILYQSMNRILTMGFQFVLLGTGDKFYEEAFANLGIEHPGTVSSTIGFNSVLAQKIYAGSDLFMMPSLYEPCGLGQLIAMRYGSIPVVRKTGGLADTVMDYDEKTGSGNGFVFTGYSSKELLDAAKRAGNLYGNKNAWQRLVRETMEMDFSWNRSAGLYTELYVEALGRRGRVERPTDYYDVKVS